MLVLIMIKTSDISVKSVIKLNNKYWVIKNIESVKPGKGPAYKKLSLKNINDGVAYVYTLGANEELEVAESSNKTVIFSHLDKDIAYFLQGAEMIEVDINIIKNEIKFLVSDLQVIIKEVNNNIIGIELPLKIDYIVENVDASGYKTQDKQIAIINQQIRISLPAFIKIGDKIRINTENCSFEERVK